MFKPIFMSWVIVGVGWLFYLLLSPFSVASQNKSSNEVSVESGPSLGSASAPVTIIEFSDFQCSYCKRFLGRDSAQAQGGLHQYRQGAFWLSPLRYPRKTFRASCPGVGVRRGARKILGVSRPVIQESGRFGLHRIQAQTVRARYRLERRRLRDLPRNRQV